MKQEEVNPAILSVSRLFFSGADAHQLLEKARTYLGNPVIITNSSLETIACSKEAEIKDAIWQRMISKGRERYQLLKELTDSGIVAALSKSSKPALVDSPAMEHRYICGPLTAGNEFIGQVTILEYHRTFEEGDFEFVQALCEIFTYFIINSSGLRNLENRNYELLLADLFKGSYHNRKVITEVLNYIDWSQNQVHQVLVARGDPQFNQYNIFPIKDLLENIDYGIKGIVLEDRIAMLISLVDKKLPRLKSEILERVEALLREHHFTAGISRLYTDIDQTYNHYQEAAAALNLLRHFESPCRLLHYNDIALEDGFAILSKDHDLRRFFDDDLTKILEYDQAHQTYYLRDVYAVIVTGGNLRQSAELLNIHRNTLNYRIEKIQQLFEVNLSDPETAFKLNLSLRMLKFTEGVNFYKKYQIPR